MNNSVVFSDNDVVTLNGISKEFAMRRLRISQFFNPPETVRALDNVSLGIQKGQVLCLVGESGCGKTTTGKILACIYRPTAGEIHYRGRSVYTLPNSEFQYFRRETVQLVYQDPYSALNPRWKVKNIVKEALDVNKRQGNRLKQVVDALALARLQPPEKYLERRPPELSGGERQRVAIARVLVMQPGVVVADEPVSMLDASIRIGILNLFTELTQTLHWALLFITHDLAQANYVGNNIAVMYLGQIVEYGKVKEVIREPLHPYMVALISNVPKIGRRGEKRVRLSGEPPSGVKIPDGCRFHPRCYMSNDTCTRVAPVLRNRGRRAVRCHNVGETNEAVSA